MVPTSSTAFLTLSKRNDIMAIGDGSLPSDCGLSSDGGLSSDCGSKFGDVEEVELKSRSSVRLYLPKVDTAQLTLTKYSSR